MPKECPILSKSRSFVLTDVVVECFLEVALEEFTIGCIDRQQWHPDFMSHRVALFVLVKKVEASMQTDFENL
jgi:hypothetical protein